ncbi:MAG: hypothetical protein J6M34_04795 [Clostridia bacterium]|nr:hypothetical protein [Clostridia bacterium]
MELEKVKRLYDLCYEKRKGAVKCFQSVGRQLPFISDAYPGIWLETSVYGSLLLARMEPEGLQIAENTVNTFLDYQTPDGQLPSHILDAASCPPDFNGELVGYSQIQECVSFARLCLLIYEMNGDMAFLKRCYEGGKAWDGWLRRNRMTTGRGLVEMFCGYDTGHDHSGRFEGISCPLNYRYYENGVKKYHNAAVLPPDDGITPILAPDINCTFYATQIALSEMAEILGFSEEAAEWREKAKAVKQKLFEHCYNEADAFFYDVDRNGNQRKYLSISILHLFMEQVLDPVEDGALIREIYERHLKNPAEFWTAYPFPATAVSDPYWQNLKNPPNNCWGYYTQTLTLQRCILWMDQYGFGEDFGEICRRWLQAYTDCFEEVPFGQEIHPITGKPTTCSPWAFGVMSFYRYTVNRLGLFETKK